MSNINLSIIENADSKFVIKQTDAEGNSMGLVADASFDTKEEAQSFLDAQASSEAAAPADAVNAVHGANTSTVAPSDASGQVSAASAHSGETSVGGQAAAPDNGSSAVSPEASDSAAANGSQVA